MSGTLGRFPLGRVTQGDSALLVPELPDESLDVVVCSPPYWGQRHASAENGAGGEEDPREYLEFLARFFASLLPKLKPEGILWVNVGDAYNTPINWSPTDARYSTLGDDRMGLAETNPAFTKPRLKRRAFLDASEGWLSYGNLLALPQRLTVSLCDAGYLFRGEVVWHKAHALPEGRCRRPHRKHEGVYLFARDERHQFRVSPSVGSVWDIPYDRLDGLQHRSRFPVELPVRCIQAYGRAGKDVVVFDPFSGSGSTGMAAKQLGCSFVGFELDGEHALAANARFRRVGSREERLPLFDGEDNEGDAPRAAAHPAGGW